MRLTRQLDDALQLRLVDHLVGDEHVVDAGHHHDLGLPDRRARHADRGVTELPLCQLGSPVGFHMWADGLPGSSQQVRQRGDVGIEDVKVYHQRWCRQRRNHVSTWRAASVARTSAYIAPRFASGSKRRDTVTNCPTAEDTDG